MTAEQITLPIHCPNCSQPMTIAVTPVSRLRPFCEPKASFIVCPMGCGATMQPKFYGEVSNVWAGHASKPLTQSA